MPNAVGRFRISVAPLREPKSGCGDRKRTYNTLGEARQAVAYSWSRTGCNLGVYRCRECGKFHITHRLEGRGDYVRFVSHPNFSGIGENGVNPGWDREGIRPRTSDEIAEERREFLRLGLAEVEGKPCSSANPLARQRGGRQPMNFRRVPGTAHVSGSGLVSCVTAP